MDVSTTPVIERIARVLAAQALSINAGGSEQSASSHVDDIWREYEGDAIAVLKTLREPDGDMAAVGDVAVWERMIAAALGLPRDADATSGSGVAAVGRVVL